MAKDSRIKQYRDAALRMHQGQFPVDVPVEGDDDLAHLGRVLLDLGRTLEKDFREADLLLEITQKINSGFLLEEALNYVYESFHSVIPYDRIGVSLLEEDGTIVRAVWARSDAPVLHIAAGYSAPLPGSSLERIIDTGMPRILNDLEQHLDLHRGSDPTRRIVAEGMRSSLTCPLIAMGKPIGFMFFSSMRVNTYSNVHVKVFQRVAGQLALSVEKSRLYQRVLEEHERAERLLRNILPGPVADRLKAEGGRIADGFSDVSVLFADLVDFTEWSAEMEPTDLVRLLNEIFLEFDDLTDRYDLEKIKTIGDSYMVAAGLPAPREDHAHAITEMGLDMLDLMRMSRFRTPQGDPIRLRIGIHSGPVVAGVIGRKKYAYDLWGDTVNWASRLETHGVPGRIHVSAATHDLLEDDYPFEPMRRVELKGKGTVNTWLLAERRHRRSTRP